MFKVPKPKISSVEVSIVTQVVTTNAIVKKGFIPGVFCAKRASWMTASLGWTTVGVVGAGAEVVSISRGTGEPSRERLSGVWTPLE